MSTISWRRLRSTRPRSSPPHCARWHLVGEVRQRWVAGTLDELDAEAELQMLAAIIMMKSGSAARHPLANQTIGATVGQIARALGSISTCPSCAHYLRLTPAQTLRAEVTRQRTPALERD